METNKQFIPECLKLPRRGEIVAEGTQVILRVISEMEKENYIAVTYEYSLFKRAYEDEAFIEMTWKEFLTDEMFVCSIYNKEINEYLGYCSIKNMQKSDWELAIEMMPNQNYGVHKGDKVGFLLIKKDNDMLLVACIE